MKNFIRIEKIVYPARSLARDGGKVIFTDEGLPKELVELRLLREKKSYAEAETLTVLEPSPHRVPPRCDHFRICSPYQYIAYPFQLELKRAQVGEMFAHDLKTEVPEFKIEPSPEIWGYRNKIHLHVIREAGAPSWAYHETGSLDRFAKISECFLIPEEINRLLHALIKIIAARSLDSIGEVTVRASSWTKTLLLILHLQSKGSEGAIKEALIPLASEFPLAGVVALFSGGGRQKEIALWGRNFLEEKIGEITYSFGPSSFFQVNLATMNRLLKNLNEALHLTGEETIADLYCGVGTFGLALAGRAKEVVGVESARDNVVFLRRNLKINRVRNFTLFPGGSEGWISKVLARKIDVLIVDPPRKGLGPAICKDILKNPPPSVVYVSCNPSTLLRDLKTLLTSYRLKNLTLYDFFPHTPHIELCALLGQT